MKTNNLFKSFLLIVSLSKLPLMAGAFNVDGIEYIEYDYNPYGNSTVYVTNGYEDENENWISITYNINGELTIPSSVTYNGNTYKVIGIYGGCFKNCRGITKVTFPSTLEYIGDEAFSGCSNLETIYFVDSRAITHFGSSVFYDTKWYSNQPDGLVYLDNGHIVYRFKGSLSQKDKQLDLRFARIIAGGCFFSQSIESVVFGSVEYIGEYAFYQTNLKYADLELVKEVGEGAFNASGLEEVVFGTNISKIGRLAFYGTSKLKNVYIRATTIPVFEDANDDGDYVGPFWNAGGNDYVTLHVQSDLIDRYRNSYQNIGHVTFKELVEVKYISEIQSEKSKILVGEQLQLTAVCKPDTASTGRCTWKSDASSIASVNNNGVVTGLSEGSANITAYPVCGNGSKSIKITVSFPTVTIGDYKYKIDEANNCAIVTANNKNITSLSFNSSVEFNNVVYPVTKMGEFNDCNNISELIIPNFIEEIEGGAFSRCTFKKVVIPSSVDKIGQQAFFSCNALEEVVFEDGENEIILGNSKYSDGIGGGLFEHCPIKNAYIGRNIKVSNYNDSYNRPWTNAPFSRWYANDYCPMTTATIAEGVTGLCDYFFERCNSITSLTSNITDPSNITLGISVFRNVPTSTCTLYVPYGSADLYRAADQWKDFTNIVEMVPPTVLATSIALDKTEAEMTEVETLTLIATVLPEDATDKSVTWTSSDESVAIVENGVVTAVAAGTATITASTTDGSNLSASCTVTVKTLSADNGFVLPDTAVLHGESITIPVRLNNTETVMAFQTDIYLPDGFTLLTDEDDEPLITPSSRLTSDHIIMADQLNDGGVRVICYNATEQLISGNEGDLFYITVVSPDDAGGDYPIYLRNGRLTNTEYNEIRVPDAGAVLTVNTYIPGDVNDSHNVNVTDIVVAAQYLLQRDPSPFVFEAADMNGDGEISVTDIMLIAYLINHPAMNAPRRMPALYDGNYRMSGEGVTMRAGETRTVSILLDNEMDYSAFQLDLTLPEGLTANNFQLTDRAGSHAFDVNAIEGNKFRALCYSPAIEAIDVHSGVLLTFDVTATGVVTSDITVDGIELVTTDCQTVRLDAFTIGVNNATVVGELTAGKTVARVDYYNVAGQRIDRPRSGVTLVVTTYTDGTRTTTKLIR